MFRRDTGGALWKSAVVLGVVALALVGAATVLDHALRAVFYGHGKSVAIDADHWFATDNRGGSFEIISVDTLRAPVTVTLTKTGADHIIIRDGRGNAMVNNISVIPDPHGDVPALINGAASFIMVLNGEAETFRPTAAGWVVE